MPKTNDDIYNLIFEAFNKLTTQNKELKAKLDSYQSEIKKIKSENEDLRADIENLTYDIRSLRQLLKNLDMKD